MTGNFFQRRVAEWLAACFPPSVCADREERMHRFLEEALELAQASRPSGPAGRLGLVIGPFQLTEQPPRQTTH